MVSMVAIFTGVCQAVDYALPRDVSPAILMNLAPSGRKPVPSALFYEKCERFYGSFCGLFVTFLF